MEELVDGKGRQCHVQETDHLVAHGVRIEGTAYRILHPCVSYQNPPGRDGSTNTCQPCSSQMEAWRYLLPTEKHHGDKGGLHKEGDDTFDGQWCTKDVAHKPRVVGPVGTKLKFQDDTCGYTHGKVDAKEALPKLCGIAPESVDRLVDNCSFEALEGTVPTRLDDTHHYGESQRQGYKEPVIDGCQRKLCSCPVDGTVVNC